MLLSEQKIRHETIFSIISEKGRLNKLKLGNSSKYLVPCCKAFLPYVLFEPLLH